MFRSILAGLLMVFSAVDRAEALSVRLTPSVGSGITVEDNDINDGDTVVGSLVCLVPVGEFVVQVTTALSKPAVGGPNSAELVLSSVAMTGGMGGVLTIEATDTGYGVGSSPSGLLLTSLIGGTSGLGLTTYQSYFDADNMPFGTTGVGVSTSGLQGPFSGSFDSTVTHTFPQSAPFSITAVAQYTMGPNQTQSFGANTIVTPLELCTGSIGDYVWLDLNRDGIQDANEPGINGVTVHLLDGNGNEIATTTTTTGGNLSQAGYYEFPDLCAGDYTVLVDTPVLLQPTISNAGSDPTIDSNGSPASVTLSTNSTTDATIDFGFISPCTGIIGDFVWHDVNRNGIQDDGDSGINGVEVTLSDAGGWVATNTTVNGFYEFAGLCAGEYTVTVNDATLPVGFSPTMSNAPGSTTYNDSNGSPALVSLPTDNATDFSIDFGYESPCTGMIGDFIWHDQDRDGIQDANEPGIEGVKVELFLGLNLQQTTNSLSNGYYDFKGLCAGDYTVVVTNPPDFSPTLVQQGSDPALDSNPNPAPVSLATDDSADDTIDFGFVSPCTAMIGDFVWEDLNRNGIQDGGERGIAGATVKLFDSSHVQKGLYTTLTDGFYQFTGLCAGTYSVEVVPPAGLAPTTSNASGSTPANDSNGSPAIVVLPQDDTFDDTIDFGYYRPTPAIEIKKYTNGEDADAPTGPYIPVGYSVVWTYVVTNTGEVDLFDVAVTDDVLGAIRCPATTLAVGASMTCEASGIAVAGQYANIGTVTGTDGTATVTDSNPSHYFGAAPAIKIVKYTNGEDADDPTGPMIPVGGAVKWTYEVTNTGNVDLSGVVVTDSKGVAVSCPATTLAVGASMTCTASGIAVAGQYANLGTVTGTDGTTTVTDKDPSHYYGANASIDIEKHTNGQDADTPTGPSIPVGGTVTWTYMVTNTGNVALSNVAVTDDKIGAITCLKSALAVGETMTCTATGIAVAGQYANLGTVTGTDGTTAVTDTDPSHYFGRISTTCTYTQGYWKTHSTYGPAPYDATWAMIGEGSLFFGTGKTWYQTITAVPKNGDAYLILAHQYIAAYLNQLNGADTSMVSDAFVNAASLLAMYDGNPHSSSEITGAVREDFIATAYVLDEYNNGLIGPSHCDSTEVKATIGDFVWNDSDKDGIQDSGEAGIRDVTVNLYDCAGNFVATAKTNSSGGYSFTVLPGEYKLGFSLKDGYLFSPKDVGLDTKDSDADLSTGLTVCTDLTPGEKDLTWDAGMYPKTATNAKIGNFVWNDKDKDGIQDKGETGIAGVTVSLFACNNGNPTTQVQEMLTVNGLYSFSVPPGSYAVQFTAPLGWLFSPKDKTNDALDSDANLTTGMTICTNLTSGETDLTWDAGLYEVPVGCTYTQGYWKTHSKYGPAPADSGWGTLADTKFLSTTKTWYQILWAEPSKGQFYLQLAHQYIAAYLNGKNGASTTAVKTQMDRAYYLLNTYGANMNNIPATLQAEFQSLAQTLDNYNNGQIGPGHCGNEVDCFALP